MGQPAIRVDGLWKKFGLTTREALRYGLIEAGEMLAVEKANQIGCAQ